MKRFTIEDCKRNFEVAMNKWSVCFGRSLKFGSEYAMDIIRYVIQMYGNGGVVVFANPVSKMKIPGSMKGYYFSSIVAMSVKDKDFWVLDENRERYPIGFTFKDRETTRFIFERIIESVNEQ